MTGSWSAAFVLGRAADISKAYDSKAQSDVLLNRTDKFHLCGLIERAASLPRSGATHRRSMGSEVIANAKAAFCMAHKVIHPSAWEYDNKPTPEQVGQALRKASNG